MDTDMRAQHDVEKLSASKIKPRGHPIIEYLAGEVVQAGQHGDELDMFALSLETVEDWCNAAAEFCPTEPGVIHVPNLSVLVDRIPRDNQWWVPPNSTHFALMYWGNGLHILFAQGWPRPLSRNHLPAHRHLLALVHRPDPMVRICMSKH